MTETVAIDVTGGEELAIDLPTVATPSDPDYREGINVWIWDNEGQICFPRMGIECVGSSWSSGRTVMFNCAQSDGKVFTTWKDHPQVTSNLATGAARVIDAGPMRFECREPFVQWQMSFDGLVEETSLRRQIAGEGPMAIGPGNRATGTVPLSFELEISSVCPPWFQGSLGGENYVPGEKRFEQLFRCEGTVNIGGNKSPFSGGGLRIHRKGGARTPSGDFFGHVWNSAFFPSGRAFGFIHYYPRPDGSLKFCEGWVIENGKRIPAQILDRPWLQNAHVDDDTFSFIIRTANGDSRVEVRSHASTIGQQSNSFPLIQQGIGQFRWMGEEAYGMIERSTWHY